MGELVGLPEWLAIALFVLLVLVVWLALGWQLGRRAQRRLAAKRPSPSKAEFVSMLSDDVEERISLWFWTLLKPYYAPLRPHPDDHLIDDACIDGDDIEMDWVPRFLRDFGLDERSWPKRWSDWPQGWELTVRNFARFLQAGKADLS